MWSMINFAVKSKPGFDFFYLLGYGNWATFGKKIENFHAILNFKHGLKNS